MSTMQSFKEHLIESEEAPEEFRTEFEVPEINIAYMKKRIEKLNKIASKLNVKPIKVTVGDSFIKQVKPEKKGFDGKVIEPAEYANFFPVKVEGETPKLSGWSFVGKLEPIQGTNEIMAKTAPGSKQIPKRYQHVDHIECEHCNRIRRRSESFIVKKGRTYKQVGRSCLKDFLGHEDPKKIADWAEVLYDIEAALTPDGESDYDFSGGRSFHAADTMTALAKSIRMIKDKGFQSRQYSDYPSSARLNDAFYPPAYPNRAKVSSHEWFEQFKIHETPEDTKQAKDMLDHFKSVWSKSSNEFELNTSKLVQGDMIATKNFGYIAAAANNWLKANANLEAKKGLMSTISNKHLGEVGAKNKFKATVISAFKYQGRSYSYYHDGMKAIVMLRSEDGHLIKMFTSHTELQKGDVVTISGKIGRHEVETYEKSPFKGMNLTIMGPGSRITVEEPEVEEGGDKFDGIESIQGKPVPDTVHSLKVTKSDQWNTTIEITPKVGSSYSKTFKNDEIKYKT